MTKHESPSYKLFLAFNYALLTAISLLCIFPLIHVLAISFSSSSAASANLVKFWPVGFTTKAYEYVLNKPEFMTALGVSLKRVMLGVVINMVLTILTAYPLARDPEKFRQRNAYAWYFFITILFNTGLIPWYMTIKTLGLTDSLWALVLYGAVPVFNVILLMNFFRQLPKEIEESAFLDGAGHMTNMWRIFVPLSAPSIATLTLFCIVGHWNSWFDGLILMNFPQHYPLQSYLQTVVVNIDTSLKSTRDIELLSIVNDRTSRAAQIFLASFPIIAVYPFLQRFFLQGMTLGSVKG
ncbi:carbohydrate ABC transporter permease [Paenibacillus sacheonensis]|uniref:ABC transporter permease subunit n=1 Tax=Paenibacillus sacheonensis TaxID=742054 RepID=A0A7X5BZJ5_9BACL|nr:carbohydrate ABC transporter permease [Paenibacillus sacheonensis]MBM7564248.1 putative aldouronate transport system permease protein [Paenibacillus sacheonensis]NBC67429.1 ABC transporter permease subunit [Paenibacillus sacheonensis]